MERSTLGSYLPDNRYELEVPSCRSIALIGVPARSKHRSQAIDTRSGIHAPAQKFDRVVKKSFRKIITKTSPALTVAAIV
jgi:hypothetical protein